MDKSLSLVVKFAALDKLTQPLRRMVDGARGAGREFAKARQAVRALEQASGKVQGFRNSQAAIGKLQGELDQARIRHRALVDQMRTEGGTPALIRNSNAAADKIQRLTDRLEGERTTLDRLSSELRGAGIDITRLGDAEARLGKELADANAHLDAQKRRLDAINTAKARIDRADQNGQRLRSTGTTLVAAGAAIGAPLVLAAEKAREFESAMADIGIAAGLARDETRKLGADIQAIAPKVAQAPEALQQGLQTLLAQGLDASTARALIAPIGRAATAQKAEVQDLANVSFSVFNNLKVPIGESARALDVMTLAGKRGGVELRDMARNFPGLTAAASGLGQVGVPAVADLAAALQIAKNGAADADEAANNVKNLLQKINARETIGNFKKFGIDLPAALKRAYAQGKTPIEAIAELTRKATGGDLSRIGFLFNDAQAQAGLRSIIQGYEKYIALRRDAGAAAGVNDADFAIRIAQDPQAAKAISDAGLGRLATTVGSLVNPSLQALQDKLAAGANAFANFAGQHPRVAQFMAMTAVGLAAVLLGVGGLAIGLGVVIGPLTRGLVQLGRLGSLLRIAGGAATALAGALGLPVIAVVAIGAAIAGAAYLIYANWTPIAGFFAGLWRGITSGAASAWAGLRSLLAPVGTLLAPLGNAFANLGGALLRFFSAIGGALGALIAPAGVALGQFVGAIASAVGGAGAWLGRLFAWFGKVVGPPALALWSGFGSVVGGVLQAIIGRVADFVNWLGKGLDYFTRLISGGAKVAGGSGAAPQGPAIAGKRAGGGPVDRGRLYLVGENGPELLQAPASGRILPNSVLRGLGTAGAGLALAAAAPAPSLSISPGRPALRAAPAPSAPAPAVGRGAQGGGVTIAGDVHLHIQQQPGEDPRALAQRVIDELERLGRDRRLSDYRDTDE